MALINSLKTTLLGATLCTFALWQSQAHASSILPLTVDLPKNAAVAQEHKVPIVIFATATWCGYCKKLEQNILEPLLENTNIEEYAEFSQLVVDQRGWSVKTFDGRTIRMSQLADDFNVQVVPMTLFLDHTGKQIVEPILGLTLEEFYPGNLERSINQALDILGNDKRLDIYKMLDEIKAK